MRLLVVYMLHTDIVEVRLILQHNKNNRLVVPGFIELAESFTSFSGVTGPT